MRGEREGGTRSPPRSPQAKIFVFQPSSLLYFENDPFYKFLGATPASTPAVLLPLSLLTPRAASPPTHPLQSSFSFCSLLPPPLCFIFSSPVARLGHSSTRGPPAILSPLLLSCSLCENLTRLSLGTPKLTHAPRTLSEHTTVCQDLPPLLLNVWAFLAVREPAKMWTRTTATEALTQLRSQCKSRESDKESHFQRVSIFHGKPRPLTKRTSRPNSLSRRDAIDEHATAILNRTLQRPTHRKQELESR